MAVQGGAGDVTVVDQEAGPGAAMADVRQQVALSLLTEFENFSVFKPGDYNRAALDTLLDQVIAWSTALAPLRQPVATAAY